MKIKIVNCEKADNCFANAHSYIYTLSMAVDDTLLNQMDTWGELKVRRSFRRPFFTLKVSDTIQAKGVLHDAIVKAGYSGDAWEAEKNHFESLLSSLEIPGEVLGHTKSVCPQCLKTIDAARIRFQSKVYLEKECPEHGFFRTLIWNGSPSYESFHRERTPVSPVSPAMDSLHGCPDDCGLCANHKQRTCCVLLEVTNQCSLRCPVCFASAEDVPRPVNPSLEDIRRRFQSMLACGGPFNIQLSGGEPTQREDLDEIIRMGKAMGFPFFQLNTNGIRIGQEPDYLKALADAGLDCVFLQFDGLSEHTSRILRGRPLLKEKLAAIEACRQAGVGVVLVPVIAPGVNDKEVGAILDFALEHLPTVRGVHFQPISYFGRYGLDQSQERFTLPDLLRAIETQTRGRMKAEDFSPGNAENPYCSFSGNFTLQEDNSLRAWKSDNKCCCKSPGDASKKAREFVARQWSAPNIAVSTSSCCETAPAASSCCCEAAPEPAASSCCSTSSLDAFLERISKYTLAVSSMAFMDAWNLDLERLQACYINVVTGGDKVKLIPFCAYNLTALDGTAKYRGKDI